MQLSAEADGLLFLSLISGRNPELLIGKHVIAAPYIKNAYGRPSWAGHGRRVSERNSRYRT